MSVMVSPKVNINLLHPNFAAKVSRLLELARERDIPLLLTSGLRSFEEQTKLYAQGRNGTPGPIVTNAQAGDSAHNWGAAVDFCKNAKDAYSDDDFFRQVGELAESCGMEWAGRWTKFKELCHIQDADFSIAELKKKYKNLFDFQKTWIVR